MVISLPSNQAYDDSTEDHKKNMLKYRGKNY